MVLIHHEGSVGATSAQITKSANFAYTPDGIEPVHLYGSLDTDLDPKSRAAAAEDRASILDSVNERAHRLMGSLGPSDRRKIDEYLTAIREIETRIGRTEDQNRQLTPEFEKPSGIPESFPEYAKLMHDLMVVAFQADVTRVATLVYGRVTSDRK